MVVSVDDTDKHLQWKNTFKGIFVIVFGVFFFGLFFTADLSRLPNQKNKSNVTVQELVLID